MIWLTVCSKNSGRSRGAWVNLGTLKEEMVNVVLHGHNPVLSEMVVKAAGDEELINAAKAKGAKGINLVGMCCTGNELLVRKGVPVAGNMLNQEPAFTSVDSRLP